MNIRHFQRRRGPNGNFSVERVFDEVRAALPPGVECSVFLCPFHRGIFRRLINIVAAMVRQRDVNHIVGDVHYLTLLLRKHKTVLTIHDCVGLNDPRPFRRFIRKQLWYVIPTKRAGVITVISEATRNDLVRAIPSAASKLQVIPDCVSAAFALSPRRFDAARYRILQVGTSDNKNLPRLAEAIRGLACELRIIGRVSNAQRQQLDRLQILYSFRFDLTDEEVVAEYRDCDVVVFASTYEGFGLPILEAQATGRPVITSSVSSMPEVAGDGACFVDPFDVQSIRAGIERVASDAAYRARLIALGLENAKKYSREAIAQRYAALYEEVNERAARRVRKLHQSGVDHVSG